MATSLSRILPRKFMKKLNSLSFDYWWAAHSPGRVGGGLRFFHGRVAPGRKRCIHDHAVDASSRFAPFNRMSRRKIPAANERGWAGSAPLAGAGR
jgi:hypothetical protein